MAPKFWLWTLPTTAGQADATLVLIQRGTITLTAVKPAYDEIVQPGWRIAYPTFRRALERVQTGKRLPYYPAEPAETRVIVQHAPTAHNAGAAHSLVSIKVLQRALIRLQVIPLAAQLNEAFIQYFQGSTAGLRQLPVTQLRQQAQQVSIALPVGIQSIACSAASIARIAGTSSSSRDATGAATPGAHVIRAED